MVIYNQSQLYKNTFPNSAKITEVGGVQEWLIWTLSKSVVPKGTVGSNPTPSASFVIIKP